MGTQVILNILDIIGNKLLLNTNHLNLKITKLNFYIHFVFKFYSKTLDMTQFEMS